jgi:cytochrome b pre-mRNA-processing protein 3
MKILREQWAGLSMAFDVALIKGDADMAGAVSRHLLSPSFSFVYLPSHSAAGG